ncbi:unnamed protein product [Darwinula stevensoni]|uniref:Uncharacterized protein n=1 Tax=Darwinula stevensoni TaxID=69355 RepID=A0A7R9AC21_9CRUS|nr:unnamed protein product [Darwinula stevensoni]CAG0899404.1 unnamed protein product [Darwinula stevensoni]
MQRSVALTLLFGLGLSLAQDQVATIYDLPNYDDTGAWSLRNQYCPDFAAGCDPYIRDNVISSACVTGVWIFYSEALYNSENFGGVEWIHGDDFCYNLGTTNNQVSSLRYAGDTNDWKFDSITLFQFDLFFGLEYFEWADTTDVQGMPAVGSIIITGQNYWTVYSSTNFSGDRVCLGVQPGQYVGFAADLTEYGITTVRSFRRGCFGDEKIHLNSDQHGVVSKAKK